MQKEPEDPKGEGMAEHLKGEDPQPNTMRHCCLKVCSRGRRRLRIPRARAWQSRRSLRASSRSSRRLTKCSKLPV